MGYNCKKNMIETFKLDDIQITVCSDIMEYIKLDIKPLGEIPENSIPDSNNDLTHGICDVKNREIYFYINDGAEYDEILEVVSHELGHIVEGGFKNNPDGNDFEANKEKANHYQDFVMTSHKITEILYDMDCYENIKWVKNI